MGKKVLALLLVFVLLFSFTVGCSNNSDNGETAGDTKTETSKGSDKESSEEASSGDEEQIILKIMDWNDSIKEYRDVFHAEFEEKHPNVKIEYTMLSIDQYQNTFMAAAASGDMPDLFMIPSGVDMNMAIDEGWIQPFDDYIEPDFLDIFVDGAIQEGVNVKNGEFYSVNNQVSLSHTNLFYNKDLFIAAGLDPEVPPTTYSELREYAKKITEAGNGEFYGIIEGGTQVNRWTAAAKDYAALGGLAHFNGQTAVNLATGTADYNDPAMLEVFDLFKGMADDKSYHPSTMSVGAPEARALFADGQAGFIMQGVWCIGVWHANNPDLNLGVAPQVYPDSGKVGGVPVASASAWLFLSSQSEHPELAAEYFQAYFSEDYSIQKDILEAGAQLSPVKGLNEKYVTDKDLLAYYTAATTHAVTYPTPKVENGETAAVFSAFKDVNPTVGDLLQGVVAGAMTDYEGALKTLSEKTDAALATAIKEAQDGGANVSIDDFKYDWDPMTNYGG